MEEHCAAGDERDAGPGEGEQNLHSLCACEEDPKPIIQERVMNDRYARCTQNQRSSSPTRAVRRLVVRADLR